MLVGRNRAKLDGVEKEIEAQDGHAVSVVCDLSDITSARRAAANIALRLVAKFVLSPLAPLMKYWSTPKRAARVIATVLTDAVPADSPNRTAVYHDEKGRPMLGSVKVRDPAFQDRVVTETRALLATAPTDGARTDR